MFTVREIVEFTGGRLSAGALNLNKRLAGVSTDSRSIRPDELFVAIPGSSFDGHNFIAQVLRRRAGAILFSHHRYSRAGPGFKDKHSIPMVRVKDTVCALGALAHYHRRRFNIPVVAITGSNGKTTTKEMLSRILKMRFNVLSNQGTENNQIGVALTLLRLRRRHKLAVVELGANHSGEIDRLSWMASPSVGIITNIGPAHLQFFRSLKGVFKAKTELIKNLIGNARLIINQDDRLLSQVKEQAVRKVSFGFSQSADFSGRIIGQSEKNISFLLNKRHHIVLKALGEHNVYNALASIACARSLGISFKAIKRALATFVAPAMRMQLLDINNIKFINDAYNANPQSFICALKFLNSYPCRGGRIVVCGDMLELGRGAQRLHFDLGRRLAKGKCDVLINVGGQARDIGRGAHFAGMSKGSICSCGNSQEAGEFLSKIAQPQDTVLIKGSRLIKMENVLKCFISSFIR